MKPIVTELEVDASPQALWEVVVDVASWPRWTSSMTSVTLVDGELAVGRRARVEQPRLPVQTWTVSALGPGRTFTWSARAAGIATDGIHEVLDSGPRASRIRLSVFQRGLLAPVVRLVLGSLTRRYVELEAAGLKAAAEDRARRGTDVGRA